MLYLLRNPQFASSAMARGLRFGGDLDIFRGEGLDRDNLLCHAIGPTASDIHRQPHDFCRGVGVGAR